MKYVMMAALVAAATTLGVSPAAQAAPDKCTWTPPGHSIFHQDNGLDIQIDWGPGGQGGRASYAGAQGKNWSGLVAGGTEPGSNTVDFQVQFTSENAPDDGAWPHNHYTGTIEPNGRVSGTTVNQAGVKNSWLETGGAWTCAAWGFGPTQP